MNILLITIGFFLGCAICYMSYREGYIHGEQTQTMRVKELEDRFNAKMDPDWKAPSGKYYTYKQFKDDEPEE